MITRQTGFTFVELMFVVAIIGILAAVAIPAYQDYTTRAKLAEALTLSEPVRKNIAAYYDRWGELPGDNTIAGLPQGQALGGRYVSSITVNQGVIDVGLINIANNVDGKSLVLRAATLDEYPQAPLVWVCGGDAVPEGRSAIGELPARDMLQGSLLPKGCRK